MTRSSYDYLPRLGPSKERLEEWNRAGLEQVDRIVAEVERRQKERFVASMRAKVKCTHVDCYETNDNVEFSAVCKSGSYPEDGADEDNTYAKFTPSASFKITIANPALLGKFRPGQKFYVDFTEAD